ncbi:MAG: response regulator [Pseudolabrys sp.]|nr:response regulator [Pseudolabrys sp.]
MSTLRVLHVDDEPDIRELVEMSLALDGGLDVRSCDSGDDALAVAANWLPDVILMDVMMPVMDGPQTLAHLRELQKTANIPVVFMTARAQTRELAQFLSLGAVGVIPKPFDPMTLAGTVRSYLQPMPDGLEGPKRAFVVRALSDARTLADYRGNLKDEIEAYSEKIEDVAHALVGAAGAHGFAAIGTVADVLLRTVEDVRTGTGDVTDIEDAIDRLVVTIDSECHQGDAAMQTMQ